VVTVVVRVGVVAGTHRITWQKGVVEQEGGARNGHDRNFGARVTEFTRLIRCLLPRRRFQNVVVVFYDS
jgi:hypothetical protein